MPLYEFVCSNCEKKYEALAKYDPKEKYDDVLCEFCGSKSKTKILSGFGVSFTNPGSSSKWDSFSYRAGFNMDKAQTERRIAERDSHMGTSKDIYGET